MAFTAIDDAKQLDRAMIDRFESHIIHPVLAACGQMRLAVDIISVRRFFRRVPEVVRASNGATYE